VEEGITMKLKGLSIKELRKLELEIKKDIKNTDNNRNRAEKTERVEKQAVSSED
jgi:hypothetical protein